MRLTLLIAGSIAICLAFVYVPSAHSLSEEARLSKEAVNAGLGSTEKLSDDESAKEEEEDAEAGKGDLEKQAANLMYSQDDSGPKPDPEAYFIRATQEMAEGKYQAALDDLNRVLKISPHHIEAAYAKGVLYQRTGHDKFAARRYLDVLKRRPDMDKARINLAALHRKHRYYSGAEEQLKTVIGHQFYSFEAHYNLANVYLDQKKYEEALKEYKICQKLKPGNAMVHNNMGVIFLEKKYVEDAINEFKRAANLEPANKLFSKNLSVAQKILKDGSSGKVWM